jgi:hypothetical protein
MIYFRDIVGKKCHPIFEPTPVKVQQRILKEQILGELAYNCLPFQTDRVIISLCVVTPYSIAS